MARARRAHKIIRLSVLPLLGHPQSIEFGQRLLGIRKQESPGGSRSEAYAPVLRRFAAGPNFMSSAAPPQAVRSVR
jgi:hypothetical protein